jgi:DNA-directed RNA polymerase subunit N (RpoN/RPB10)
VFVAGFVRTCYLCGTTLGCKFKQVSSSVLPIEKRNRTLAGIGVVQSGARTAMDEILFKSYSSLIAFTRVPTP